MVGILPKKRKKKIRTSRILVDVIDLSGEYDVIWKGDFQDFEIFNIFLL